MDHANKMHQAEPLLTPGEVASIFGVDPTTVSNWAKSGKLQALKTLGGHRRFRMSDVQQVLDQMNDPLLDGSRSAAG
ncbi:MAG: BldC family transcriptional regulator [Nocardioidaceae bacterium]